MIYNGKEVKTAVALGYFDGLHLAHTTILEKAAAEKSDGIIPFVLLFDEHPQHFISSAAVPSLLQNEKRDEILKDMGIEKYTVSFAAIRELSPESFVKDILIEKLSAAFVVCGYNYRFGKNGAGTADTLRELAGKYGMGFYMCPEMKHDGSPISSTRIRALIEEGAVKEAAAMLGRPFCFASPVFKGDRRGRTMGFPTINQYLPGGFAVPRFGVYVSEVAFAGKTYTGVTNIGSRPTFGEGTVRSETYIIGFSGDLYGETPEIRLLEFIRPEMKFASAEELSAQIEKDKKRAEGASQVKN